MKKFMKTCYRCNVDVEESTDVQEGIELYCLRCPKCKEKYFASGEIVKFEILTGRRPMVRKFGTLGDSTIVRLPPKIIKEYNIKPGDYGIFEKNEEGILIKPVAAKELRG